MNIMFVDAEYANPASCTAFVVSDDEGNYVVHEFAAASPCAAQPWPLRPEKDAASATMAMAMMGCQDDNWPGREEQVRHRRRRRNARRRLSGVGVGLWTCGGDGNCDGGGNDCITTADSLLLGAYACESPAQLPAELPTHEDEHVWPCPAVVQTGFPCVVVHPCR